MRTSEFSDDRIMFEGLSHGSKVLQLLKLRKIFNVKRDTFRGGIKKGWRD